MTKASESEYLEIHLNAQSFTAWASTANGDRFCTEAAEGTTIVSKILTLVPKGTGTLN